MIQTSKWEVEPAPWFPSWLTELADASSFAEVAQRLSQRSFEAGSSADQHVSLYARFTHPLDVLWDASAVDRLQAAGAMFGRDADWAPFDLCELQWRLNVSDPMGTRLADDMRGMTRIPPASNTPPMFVRQATAGNVLFAHATEWRVHAAAARYFAFLLNEISAELNETPWGTVAMDL
jgi:hypothetical protein